MWLPIPCHQYRLCFYHDELLELVLIMINIVSSVVQKWLLLPCNNHYCDTSKELELKLELETIFTQY